MVAEPEGFELAISPISIFTDLLTSILFTKSTEVRRKKPVRERFYRARRSTSPEVLSKNAKALAG